MRQEILEEVEVENAAAAEPAMSKIAIADGAVPTPFEEAEQVDEEAAHAPATT